MAKFRRLAALLAESGIVAEGGFHEPEPAEPETIALVHDES